VLRCQDEKARISCDAELKVLSRLRHPRVVTLMGVSREVAGYIALIMEFMAKVGLP
jgi:hypothetical protein